MNFVKLQINQDRIKPVYAIYDTLAPWVTQRSLQDCPSLQEKVQQYLKDLALLEIWQLDYHATNDVRTANEKHPAPNNLEELKEQNTTLGFFYVEVEGSSRCAWSQEANTALRHLHDCQHLKFNMGVTLAEELQLAGRLAASLRSMTGSDTMFDLIDTDFSCQAAYWCHHRSFVADQALFLQTCLFNTPEVFDFITV